MSRPFDNEPYRETFKLYEDGKHRRYELLFAVNGGAFAVAKLFSKCNAASFVGGLTLREVACGLAAFTVLMFIDIWVFGWRMRRAIEGGATPWNRGVFSAWGMGVLAGLCFLIVAGWLLVAYGPAPDCVVPAVSPAR
jgi:hypothetical protein